MNLCIREEDYILQVSAESSTAPRCIEFNKVFF